MTVSLSQRISTGQFVLAPGVHDALAARIAAEVGFEVVYMTGFGVAASFGLPDVGLLTMTEMVETVRRITDATDLAVIADADTGYGNPVNVGRTVRQYERAGASGMHIEDQVFPKKCGFMRGKQVIPAREHAAKIRAACDARDNDDFVIIGRTDALAVTGWDDVEERMNLYREAGADLVFVDGIKTTEDLDEYVRRIVDSGLPTFYNGALRPSSEIERLGFKVQIVPGACLGPVVAGLQEAYEGLYRHGTISPIPGAGFKRVTSLLGLPEIYELEARYSTQS